MPANEQYKYNLKKMHVIFCASVLAFAGATIFMLYRDHDDEWRDYQRNFLKIEATLLERERAAVLTAAGGAEGYQKTVDDLNAKVAVLDEKLGQGNADFQEKSTKVADLQREFLLKGREVRFKRADRDVARANLDLGIRDAVSEDQIASLKAKFDEWQGVVEKLETEWEVINTNLKNAQAELAKVTAERDDLKDQRKKAGVEVTRINDALTEIAPDGGLRKFKRTIMEWPIIDGFHSHLVVKQDWLPDLKVKLGMTSTARFDRCRTCHLGIDRFGNGNVATFPHGKESEGKYSHPYASHPRPDVYLTATSPHPMASFGCTICHDGAGSATSFHNAQHGPNDPHEDHKWNKEYGYFHNHFWEYPMLPERLRESSCIKCHHEVVELGVNPTYGATAPKAYQGWEIVSKFGCFGCHEINGFEGKNRIGPDLRLEPTAEEEPKFAADPNLVRGKMRKVGPSLQHVAQKTSAEWISYWTEEPKRFRPETRMPQFFGLTNLEDHIGKQLSAVEIAGIGAFLTKQSTDVELLKPEAGYQPSAERGKVAFGQRGCLACHSHDAEEFKASKADFGPNLTNVSHKLAAGDKGFAWLYTWIRDPQKHHPRSKMPNLFLEPIKSAEGALEADPAADIAAYLLSGGPKDYPKRDFDAEALKELLKVNLAGKALTTAQYEGFMTSRKFPIPKAQLKGDEIELVYEGEGAPNDEQWNGMLLNYVGRRAVSRYGCYGCHDINGYGSGRPIGTGLADWGRKDTGRLALEHIAEFLHHHGEADGSSTSKYIADAMKNAASDSFDSPEAKENGLRRAFFYESLEHHGRPGFIFQKLRDPRSYDYKKVETKKYNERLVMPKFPFTDDQIEAVATFVLGLVSDPPASKYLYKPDQRLTDRNQGEILLRKYNCVSCHMTDLHKFEYGVEEGELAASELAPTEHPEGMDALLSWRPPRPAITGRTHKFGDKTLPTVEMRGIPLLYPNPEDEPEDRIYTVDTWEPATLHTAAEVEALQRKNQKIDQVILPGSRLVVNASKLVHHQPASSGHFAEWLVDSLAASRTQGNKYAAWQMVPPPLFREGQKVQTPWLYRFLKEPEQIRYTVALRMPRFNMSDEEAQTLANYFAAVDGAPYPYQEIQQAEPEHVAAAQVKFEEEHKARAEKTSYADESWNMLTADNTLCIKCHAVGGRPFTARPNDPNVTRGPNLERVAQRLRPDWVNVWLHKPQWITPYTGMPLPFPRGKEDYKPLFDGNPVHQTAGVRDALFNYYHLLERKPKAPTDVVAVPPQAAPAAPNN